MLNKWIIFVGSLLISVVVSEIQLGSKLSVSDNDFWVSSNGDFALGFFSKFELPYQYSVGIRFNSHSIPADKQTVVWVAGAEVTVSNHSYFQLTPDGELVLFDSSKEEFAWRSNTHNKSVSAATLLDDGNLVLLNGDNDLVWQSFDYPSDTLLPGQNLSSNEKLRAASGNSVSSYYSLYMSDLGQLQLKWESSTTYWESGSPLNKSLRGFLNSNGSFQLLGDGSGPVWSIFAEDHDDNVRFRFLRLDADGNLRLYSWDEGSESWRSVWQAVENQCDVFATCGDLGICAFNVSGSTICKCPFRSSVDSSSKCVIPYGHSCDSRISMVTYKNTYLHGLYPPIDSVNITSLEECRSICLRDTLCTAVTYVNDGTGQCQMMSTQYVTGYVDPTLTSLSFVKTCLDPFAVLPHKTPTLSSPLSPCPPSTVSTRPHGFGVRSLMGAALGTFCMFVVLQIVVGIWLYRKRVSVNKQGSSAYAGSKSAGMVRWTFAEIKELTGNFKHQLGPRSFKATVYNNQPVVVKQLDPSVEERKFRAMIMIVGSIYHKNLVKLEGYCIESGNRFLVYEFLKNGSLEQCLQDPKLGKRLTWKKRMSISLAVSKAIFYLHTECRVFVSHGNLKCRNIILDENLEAKVTGFGLEEQVDGSFGSETAEKDVLDFGKVVLALISGRLGDEDLGEWSYNKWISGYAWRVVDKRIEGEVNFDELERALRIAYWCLQDDERMRPSMGEVVNVLQGTLPVDPPPPPFSRLRTLQEELSMDRELEQ